MADQLEILRSRHKSNQQSIKEDFAKEYGIALLAILRCNNVNASEMDKVCEIIEEYKKDLANIGIKA